VHNINTILFLDKQLRSIYSFKGNIMKNLTIALVTVLLVATQIFTPVVASSNPSHPATSSCGTTYTVQRGDYLKLIANLCGISYADLLAYNPQITNPNWIYPGQVIRLTGTGGDPYIPITGSTYIVQPGDTLGLIAYRYGTTVYEILRINPSIYNPSLIYIGQFIFLPVPGGGGGGGVLTGARVTLSALSAKAGNTITVSVTGFPANAELDFRVGKVGATYTTVYDSTTDAYGKASTTITIPGAAVANERWVVVVMTTSLVKAKSVTISSPSILIIN
jgi:LysM repeat protein